MHSQTATNTILPDAPPRIEGFEIVERLGVGGTSSVWKARQLSLQRFVVIKVLSSYFAQDEKDIKQFRQEAQIAANLKHNGIVQVYDFGQSRDDQRYYFIMEYISGYSVGEWLRRKTIIPEHDALVVAHSVALALRYAWEKANIVHCDLKPDNIMIDGDGTIKLTDLGLAQVVNTISYRADRPADFVMGTPNYMSPEQVRGDTRLDCRSDIYALGMSLYHMVTGKLPFAHPLPAVVMESQLRETLPHPQQANPALSSATAQLIERMTAKLSGERYQTWAETIEAIAAAEKGQAAPAPVAAPAPPEPVRKCPQCGGTLRDHAQFCPQCGKQTKTVAAPRPATEKPKVKLRVRPISELRPVPAPAPTVTRPVAVARSTKKSKKKTSWFAELFANLRMVASITLLIFIGYCTYQKLVHHRDIILPWRIHFQRMLGVYFSEAQAKVSDYIQRFLPQAAPPPEAPPAPSLVQPAEEEASAAPEAAPQATITDAGAAPEDADPLLNEAIGSGNDSAPDAEYQRLLELCRQDTPKIGDKIAIPLKHQDTKREGILHEIGNDGLLVAVDAGLLKIPFGVMRNDYRLRFFPEERAQRLMQMWREKTAAAHN